MLLAAREWDSQLFASYSQLKNAPTNVEVLQMARTGTVHIRAPEVVTW